MKINEKDLHNIISRAKSHFVEQPLHLYWNRKMASSELTYDEKRIVCILEAAGIVTQTDVKIKYEEIL